MSRVPALTPPSAGLPVRGLWLAAVAVGHLAFVVEPGWSRALGLFHDGTWFLDSRAILASIDAVRAGLDPWQPNPLDPLGRPHSYSGWWLRGADLGLTREHNFLVGGAWVLAFLASAAALVRPRTLGAAAVAAAVLLSPPVLLGVNRANNDLVIFALLAAGLLAWNPARPWSPVWLVAAAVLSTGLKFYPVAAALGLVALRPGRAAWLWTAAGLAAAGLTLLSVWGDVGRAVVPTPGGLHAFGAGILARDAGWGAGGFAAWAAMGLAAGAVWGGRQGWFEEPASDDDGRARLAFGVGAALLVACFLGVISYGYRLVFGILLLPFLLSGAGGRAGRWTLGLLLAQLWLDGLYCLATNLLLGPRPAAVIWEEQRAWRLATQVVPWSLSVLLAGWLLAWVPRPARWSGR